MENTGTHLCWSYFLIKLQALWSATLFERDLTRVFFSCEYCEIFTKSFLNRKPPVAYVDFLFLTKSNVGWFLLKRVDLVIVRVIYILLVETIPTRFY